MLGIKGLLTASACLFFVGCVGDEFLVGGGGNDGSGGGTTGTVAGPGSSGSTGTDAGSSSSSSGSGGCGCMADGACQAGDAVDACGAAGAACQACTTDLLCQTPSCAGGACATVPANEGDPCPFVAGDETSGRCVTGQCLEAPEDCLNGVDDDEDGEPDCLDSDCDVAFVCAKDTPVGWTGPFAVYEGAVECPGVWGVVVAGPFGRDPTADDYTCECTATVEGCDDISFTYGNSVLAGDVCAGDDSPEIITLGATDCASLGDPTTSSFAHLAVLADDVTCTGTTAAGFEIPPPSFETVFTVCDAPVPEGGVGCDAGACRPRVPDSGGAQGDICIMRAGNDDCPDPFIVVLDSPSSGFADTRGCDCACTAPDCNAEIGFYDEDGCAECEGAAGACAELGLGALDCTSDIPDAMELWAGWAPDPTYTTADDEIGTLAGVPLKICCLP